MQKGKNSIGFDLTKSRTPKRHFTGTHRSLAPQETWQRLAPLIGKFGITRIADITGLDRIGIQVATATRPLSRSIAVAAGKGVDLAAAKVSAAMEAIECAHAEAIDRPLVLASREELRRRRRVVALEALPVLIGSQIDEHTRLLWIEGRDIANDSVIMLPYELVHAHFAPPHLPGSGAFLATTNGLASGNAIAEATCHGLFEVIERDALNLWSRLAPVKRNERLVDLSNVTDAAASAVVDRLMDAGFEVAVWDITSDLKVPAFHCMIVDALEPEGHPGTGSGCHPDKNVALSRALLEAVQVRGTYISGGRDDLSRREYEASHMQSFRNLVEGRHGESKPRRFEHLASSRTEYFEDDLASAIANFKGAKIDSVIVVDLSEPDRSAVHVVRVVVPGLEGPLTEDAHPGERALRLSQ